MGSNRTKAELIAELEAMRHRMKTLEKRPGKENRSNYLLRIFIDSLPNFGFSFDADGRILQVLTGPQLSETRVLEGRLLVDVLPQADAEELEAALRRTIETGEIQQFEFILSVMAGRRWYRVTTSLAPDQNGAEKIAVFLFQDITNEKLAEGVLKSAQLELETQKAERTNAEERASGLIGNSLLSVYIHRDYGFLYANQSCAELFGYSSPEEVLAIGDVLQFDAPEERDRLFGYYQELISGGTPPARYEFQGLRKDGSLIWLENLVQVVEWKGKQAVMVTILDITARKRAEQELRASQRLLQAVFDSNPHGLFVRDKEGRFLMVNEVLANRYGLTPGEFEQPVRQGYLSACLNYLLI